MPLRHVLSGIGGLLAMSALAATGAERACKLDAPDAAHAGVQCAGAWYDANLRLDEIQLVGTADSYKLRPSDGILRLARMGGKKDAEALDFGEPPLAAQLDANARALSFDIAYDPKGGLFKNPAGASMAMDLLDPGYGAAMAQPGFKVIHVLDIDYQSSCLTLEACLGQVAAWSRTHPDHIPIVIALRANDEKTPMPGATRPLPFDAAAFDALDDAIRAIFKPSELITPDMLRGGDATLRQAALAHAWPKLGQVRGRVIFVLQDNARKAALYAKGHDGLAGRAMFVTAAENSPLAAFVAIEDPRKESARIAAAAAAGFIVITRADSDVVEARANDTARRDAAFASGAQIVTTDFLLPDAKIGPYQVNLKGERAVCDVKVLGANCSDWSAEHIVTATR